MRCTGSCNQGRNCTCTKDLPIDYAENQLTRWDEEEKEQRAAKREEYFTLACAIALVVVMILWFAGLIGIAP